MGLRGSPGKRKPLLFGGEGQPPSAAAPDPEVEGADRADQGGTDAGRAGARASTPHPATRASRARPPGAGCAPMTPQVPVPGTELGGAELSPLLSLPRPIPGPQPRPPIQASWASAIRGSPDIPQRGARACSHVPLVSRILRGGCPERPRTPERDTHDGGERPEPETCRAGALR